MKERVFYVINLDNRRIITLGLFLVALLSSLFFLGLSVGKRKGTLDAYKNTINNQQHKVELSNISPTVTEPDNIEKTDNVYLNEEIITTSPVSTNEKDITKTEEKIVKHEEILESRPETVVEKTPVKRIKHINRTVEKYTIQVAAFTKESQAQRLVRKIKSNRKITSVTYIKPDGKYYMVRIGKYKNRSSIEKLQSVVNKELKVKSMILKKKF